MVTAGGWSFIGLRVYVQNLGFYYRGDPLRVLLRSKEAGLCELSSRHEPLFPWHPKIDNEIGMRESNLTMSLAIGPSPEGQTSDPMSDRIARACRRVTPICEEHRSYCRPDLSDRPDTVRSRAVLRVVPQGLCRHGLSQRHAKHPPQLG